MYDVKDTAQLPILEDAAAQPYGWPHDGTGGGGAVLEGDTQWAI